MVGHRALTRENARPESTRLRVCCGVDSLDTVLNELASHGRPKLGVRHLHVQVEGFATESETAVAQLLSEWTADEPKRAPTVHGKAASQPRLCCCLRSEHAVHVARSALRA